MALHFERSEYAGRIARARAALTDRDLDGLLLFAQESMYYLTGYDSFGFCFFQCLYLGTDGTLALLTRSADLRQAHHTSIVDDVRIWTDQAGAQPAMQLREMLASLGARGTRLGVEYDTHGLTARNGKALDAALEGFCTLADASDLVSCLRLVKSPAELVYVRRAGELADAAWDAALATAGPGVDEGEILAEMHRAIFAGGGDYPGNEFIIGSGPDALLVRYKSGRRTLSANDQLTLEWAGTYRHYHAALMRTAIIGEPGPEQRALFDTVRAALTACEETLRPGRTAGEVFDAHARVMDAAGSRPHRLNACGYSLGARFTPSWMDQPMFYHGNEAELGPGMVFFAHMILLDSGNHRAMTLGRSYLVTDTEPEPLSRAPLELAVCR